jgi:asparagine synthase (glutamine-hydrolysing)
MCGIWCCFHNKEEKTETGVWYLSKRGPDQIVSTILENVVLGFTHLKINGWSSQPLQCGKWWVLCNGEIFNHKKLEEDLDIIPPPNSSDCWILPYMFEKYGPEKTCTKLDGEFAIIAYDSQENKLYACRDLFGIKPLFYGRTDNAFYLSSEIKALSTHNAEWVQPGTCMTIDSSFNAITTQYRPRSYFKLDIPENDLINVIRDTLILAVEKRCMSDKPVAALLSGGLDSSIICSILSKQVPELHTFSVGMLDSPDLYHARIVADHIGSIHHELILEPEDFKYAVDSVIRDIESYDITTVRASVGNWLLGEHIARTTDFKVIFNGDGSDELLGGYLYFNRAPSDSEFENEIGRLLNEIHMYDVLRSERSMSSHGLESRTPYLDHDFVALCRSIPTKLLRNEKAILRKAFEGWLPPEILYRRKEAFSDGVSMNPWFTRDNEKQYYSDIFSRYYKHRIIPHMWMPRWSPDTQDPSARTLSIYKKEGSYT